MDYFTVQEVAEKLGVKPQTVYMWASERKMDSRKIGGALRFLQEDLDAFVVKREALTLRPRNFIRVKKQS